MATRKNFPNRKVARKEKALVRTEASNKLSLAQKLERAVLGSKEFKRLIEQVQK